MAEPEPTMTPAPRRHLAGGALASVIADVGPLAAMGVLSIVLARAVGPTANGEYALIGTVVNVAVLMFSLGLSSGITYQVSRGIWAVGSAARESYAVALAMGLLGAAAGFAFYVVTRHDVLRSLDTAIVLLGVCSIPALVAVQFAIAILLGVDRYERYAALQLTTSAVTLVVGGGLAIPFGLTGALIGFAAAAVTTATVGALLLRRTAAEMGPRPPAGSPMRAALHFGLPGWIGNIFQQANYRFDVVILAGYAATAKVGVYSVALTLTGLAWVLPHGLQMVIFPRTANLDAAAQSGELSAEESDAAVTRGTRHSVLLLVPSGLIVAVLLAITPLVYGPRFGQTVALGFILLPGVLALGAAKVLGSVVAGRGAPRYNLYTSIIVLAITLALYFTLIPAHAEWGAAIASSISYLATAVITAVFFRRFLGIRLARALIPTRADLRNYPEALAALRTHLRTRRAGRTRVT